MTAALASKAFDWRQHFFCHLPKVLTKTPPFSAKLQERSLLLLLCRDEQPGKTRDTMFFRFLHGNSTRYEQFRAAEDCCVLPALALPTPAMSFHRSTLPPKSGSYRCSASSHPEFRLQLTKSFTMNEKEQGKNEMKSRRIVLRRVQKHQLRAY